MAPGSCTLVQRLTFYFVSLLLAQSSGPGSILGMSRSESTIRANLFMLLPFMYYMLIFVSKTV